MKGNLKNLIGLVIILLLTEHIQSASQFKLYPLSDNYFEKIYTILHNGHNYFLNITCKQQNMLSLSITPSLNFIEQPRFNIYGNLQTKPRMGRNTYTFLRQCRAYVEVNTSNFLQVKRQKNGEAIFTISNITFQDNHNIFTILDESVKWGLGQRFQRKFRVIEGKWTIWNRDRPWKIDDGKTGESSQTYGHHPLYLARETKSKLHHIAYFKNTHGLMVDSKKNGNELIYHSIGGQIAFVILLGQEDPQPLLEQYHQYIGPGHIPPFWSFGNHQCRWGYKSISQIQSVVKKYGQHNIPLDTIWSDLEYMDRKMIFTINEVTHPSKQFNNLLKDEGIHFVPLIDVGVSVNDRIAMDSGKQLNVFLKKDGNIYTGQVWPGVVHFVDFLHPNGTIYWKGQLARLQKSINFSGIWLDMNEPSNFRGNEYINEAFPIQQNQNINMMTINAALDHYNAADPNTPLKHKEVHAYYGHLGAVAIYQYLKQKGRPFIISRSTSVGSGQFMGHWTGDNVANWDFLRLSISGNFLFQIFGIQMVGADICGFEKDTTEQLCSRWYQIGALYPFSRNHNTLEGRSQQPWTFGKNLLQTSRFSVKTRYALLKQLYSIFLFKKGKGSYYRPITFQFFDDQSAYEEQSIETQVLLGKSLMSAPIVYANQQKREVYFPGATQQWFQFEININSGRVQQRKITLFAGRSKTTIINTLPSPPPLFLRAGYLLLTNVPENRSTRLNNVFSLFAAIKDGVAKGEIMGIADFNDESLISKCIDENCKFQFTVSNVNGEQARFSWKYTGNQGIMSTLKIDHIFIVAGPKKWTSSQAIIVNSKQGASDIMLQEII